MRPDGSVADLRAGGGWEQYPSMKCPACKGLLREKNAGNITLDTCYGGCGGIWFDPAELQRVDARAATTLHTVWQDPNKKVVLTEPRLCPRCPDQILDRRWFSETKDVEIDQCPQCGGLWLDAGEFSRIYQEVKGARTAPPGWATAMAEAAACVEERMARKQDPVAGEGAAPAA